MHILAISGFLGAGKTTFIKKLAEMVDGNFAILENEYGEVGVDGSFLRGSENEADNELKIWEMTEGCICCSVKADFAASILTIANTLNPDYLIVEPTGVGRLSNIIKNINRIEYDRIRLLKPLTIVDAGCFASDLNEFGDIYEDQIISTDQIILSKTENMTESELQPVIDGIRDLNPGAAIQSRHYSAMHRDWWESLFRSNSGQPVLRPAIGLDAPDLENIGFKGVALPSIGSLVKLLEETIHGCFGVIKRAKGCVRIGGHQLRFDVISGSYCITGISGDPENNVIFIGKGLNRKELKARVKT